MDMIELESEHEILQMWENRYIDDLGEMQLEILKHEMQENEKLQASEVPQDLKSKMQQLHSACQRCNEMHGEILKEEKSLKEFQIMQLEDDFKQRMGSMTWQDKAAAKARINFMKDKLVITRHFNASLEKKWKDMIKNVASLKSAAHSWVSSPCTDLNFLSGYLEQRLKDKQADLARLQKQRKRFEKLKRMVSAKSSLDDLSSVSTSDAGSMSDFESDLTPMSKAMQEYIALTMEKQQLDQNIKCITSQNEAKEQRLEKAKEKLRFLKKKLEQKNAIVEELNATKEATENVDRKIANLEAHCATLQQQADLNNEKIHKVKDSIIELQAQTPEGAASDVELAQAQELEELLPAKKKELKQMLEKIEAATNERNQLKEQNKLLSAEYEEIHSKNEQMEKDIKERKAKEDEEVNSLQIRIKQQQTEIGCKTHSIKQLEERIAELDKKIEEATAESLKVMNKSRAEKQTIQTDITELESEMQTLANMIIKTKNENAEAEKKLSELESNLAEKVLVQKELQQRLDVVIQDTELAKSLIKDAEEMVQKAQQVNKEQPTKEGKGLLPWLWGRWAQTGAADGQATSDEAPGDHKQTPDLEMS